jgi:hypothetical protein
MSPLLRIGQRAALTLTLLTLLILGATARAPVTGAAGQARLEVAVGGVRDACTGAHLGGAALTFTQSGTPELPPSPPVRVTTNHGGQFELKLAPGNYSVAVALDGYSQTGNTDGDPDSVITMSTGRANHFTFVLHPPSPC